MSQSATEHVAAEVRAELARQGHDNTWLAGQLRVSEMWVSRRLRNITKFSVDDLTRVAAVLDVPVGQFLPAEVVA
jgi:hypothetical protein